MSDNELHERDHAAAAYYAPATGAPATAKDLTALGVLAFVTAAIATVSTCVVALVLPRAARIRAGGGLDAVDWSLGVYYAATALARRLVAAVGHQGLGVLAGAVQPHRAGDEARHQTDKRERGGGVVDAQAPVDGVEPPAGPDPGSPREDQGHDAGGDRRDRRGHEGQHAQGGEVLAVAGAPVAGA